MKLIRRLIWLVVMIGIIIFVFSTLIIYKDGDFYLIDTKYRHTNPGDTVCAALTPECGYCGNYPEAGIVKNNRCYLVIEKSGK